MASTPREREPPEGTANLQAVAVPAATSKSVCGLVLAASLLLLSRAHAQSPAALARGASGEAAAPSDLEILGSPERGVHIESWRMRMGYYFQNGRGFQSAAGPSAGPGSEKLWVFQPVGMVVLRQNPALRHRFVLQSDIVTAASPDAIDITSRASAITESAALEITTEAKVTPVDTLTIEGRYHQEEQLGSASSIIGYQRSLAEDNATVSVSLGATADRRESYTRLGEFEGLRNRVALNANIGGSQLLSPTTIVSTSYGITHQQGDLSTTYHVVPVVGGLDTTSEELPRTRRRQSISGDVAQRIVPTSTTLRADYRHYWDDFDLRAHTAEVQLIQDLTSWMMVRGSYRFHRQTGVDFFTTAAPIGIAASEPRTADSDLAEFDAHEVGVKLTWFFTPLRSFDLTYFRYERSNDLHMDYFALSIAETF